MKIEKLRAENINSLKNVEIDFEKFLQGNTLFAITGDTGSGKSTLLDVICCALYGRTPRLGKEIGELMTRGEAKSLCEVEFSINEKTYRSTWRLNRARNRPDGKLQNAQMEIADITEGKDEILESYVSKVPKKVEEITGLDFDRFTKSMLLAQGGFDAFLKAKEKERSELLEKMTGTKIYALISQKVYEKTKEIQRERELLQAQIEGIACLQPQMRNELETLQKELERNIHIQEKKVQNFQNEIERQKEVEEAKSKEKNLQPEIEKLQKNNQTLTEKLQFQKEEFASLQNSTQAVLEKIKKAKEKAIRIEEMQKQRKVESLQLQNKKTALKDAIDTIEHLRSKRETKNKELKELESFFKQNASMQNIENDLPSIKLLSDQLFSDEKKLSQIETNIKKEQEELTKLQAKLDATIETSDKEEKELLEEKNILTSIESQLKKIPNPQTLLEKKQNLLHFMEEFTKQEENTTKLEQLKTEITLLEQEKDKKFLEKSSLETLLEEKRSHKVTLEQKYKNELLLQKYEEDRKLLKEGEACFLCGSTHHPYIRQAPQVTHSDTQAEIFKIDEEIKQLQTNIAKLQNELVALEKDIQTSKEKQEELQSSISSFNKTLSNTTLTTKEQMQKELQEVQKLYENVQELQKQRESRYKQIEHLQNLSKQSQTNITQLKTKKASFESSLDAQKRQVDTLKKDIEKTVDEIKRYIMRYTKKFDKTKLNQIVEELYDKAEIYEKKKTKLQQVQEEINILQVELQNKNEEIQKLNKEKEALEIVVSSIDEEVKNLFTQQKALIAREDLDDYQKELEEMLYEKSNTLNETYTQLKTTQKTLELKQNELEKTKEKLEQLKKKQIENFASYTLHDLQKNLDEEKKRLFKQNRELGEINQKLKTDTANREKMHQKQKELQKQTQIAKIYEKLNDLIGSQNGSKFSRFAQAITLDYLVHLANKNLAELTDRYYLVHNEESKKDLDLSIIDRHRFDAIRPVSTLSGGESFLVSLALSLGLSELASQKISIDSLFLDEGFGTLDAQTLDTALDALNKLENRGKMVGIISHVEMLKERIPLRISIKKGSMGISEVELIN